MSTLGNGAPTLGAAEIASRQKQSEPAVMDGLSSSKVTVEYHDPSGLFPLVQEQLVSRFPLKNLHWKAPTRPLRSIDSLHVDLVPSADTASQVDLADGPQSTPTPTNTEHGKGASKERRHQIPGLRQTPYLKLYLLRCDDSDAYKSTARKQVREWVKTHTPPSQSSSSANKQENHDAFEWMIVHVVLPDTLAASQPRGSTSTASGEKEKSNIASRFTKGTTTILEKLRADFNTASKSAPERVTQVRLQKGTVPPHMLPNTAPVTSPPIAESPQEQERAWNDVIVKFKTLILLSFDLRVGQYEEDIREKDSQRSLPGWNFCTFFILKEGLARGFESVGLVEDALLGYDELSIGLDTVIREQAAEGTGAGVISQYSEDLYVQASKILDFAQNEHDDGVEPPRFHDDNPINANKKDYRGQILSNNISVFDFRLYIFARQMSLLLRLGNSQSARSDLAAKLQPRPNAGALQRSVDDSEVGVKSGSSSADSEDLFSLAELCARALNFITSAGRLLRSDLTIGAKSHNSEFSEQFIDNIVRSWTFSALEQVLRETSTSSLPFTKYSGDTGTGSSSKTLPFGKNAKEQKIVMSEPKSMIHPSRSSSLNYGRSQSSDAPYAQPPASAQTIFENGQYQDRTTPNQDTSLQQAKNGQQELAGTRAQLLIVQRRILEHVGKSLGWNIGWAAILPTIDPKGGDYSDVDLEDKDRSDEKDSSDEESSRSEAEDTLNAPLIGVSVAALSNATASIEKFRHFYEALSDLIVKHYMAAGQNKSGESILGDLAALRFELGDFAAAAMYFGRMASMFAKSRWNTVETTMLKMYAQCLKKLNRKDEFVRTLLDVLAKSAASKRAVKTNANRGRLEGRPPQMPSDWLDDDKVNTAGIFAELVEYSQRLPYDVNVQMAKYFNDIVVEPYVRHFDDKDGFQLRLQFKHLLEDEVDFDQARIHLIDATSAQGRDIWLENTEVVQSKKGVCRIWLGSNTNTTGAYIVDKIVLQTKRIAFVHEPFTKAEATTPLGIITSVSATSLKSAKKNRVLCFPRTEAFQARLYLSHFIHIDKPRHIEIECSSGWNNIQRAEIRLKSASAGLRLRTANATTTSGDAKVVDKPKPGVVCIGDMPAGTTATFQIPYETETMLPDLTVRMEIEYSTENGQFLYYSSFTIPVELPLDVNVHDHFKNSALFSKFNIKTASQVPLEILDVSLEGSGEYDVSAPRKPNGPFHVFPKQPIAVTYKVTKKGAETGYRQSQALNNGSLALSVEYRCADEDVLERVQALFASAIEGSPVHRLTRLLVDTFADRLRHRILPPQFERIALLDKVDLGPFDDVGWSECIESLPQIVRDDTRMWLEKWHQSHRSIFLPKTSDPATQAPSTAPPSPYPPRRMTITVSIPQTHILHTASLSLTSPEAPSTHGSTIAVVGQPLMTELSIKHTRRWCTQSSLLPAANLSSPDDPMDFVYTLEAHPDTWLVAGQRRVHFTSREDEEHKFSVMLIPLRCGTALLPNVEIRARIAPKSEDDKKKDGSGEADEPLNCETDYLAYGECVVVVPDVRSSTVGIGEMSSTRSAIWLEAESR